VIATVPVPVIAAVVVARISRMIVAAGKPNTGHSEDGGESECLNTHYNPRLLEPKPLRQGQNSA